MATPIHLKTNPSTRLAKAIFNATKLFVAGILVILLTAETSLAQNRNWGLTSGDWNVDTNWSPADVPNTLSESATLGGTTGYTVTFDLSTTQIGGLSITNSNAHLLIKPDTSNTSLVVDDSFTNNGTISLNSDTLLDASLTVTTGGVLTNSGVINFGGTSTDSGTQRRLSADVINNGTLNVNQDGHLNRSGGVFTNNSLVSIDAGKTLDFQLSVGTFNQDAGTLANNGTFNFSGDTLNFNGGNITGNAIDLTSNSTLNIGAGSTGTGTFNMTSTGSYSGDLAAAQTLNILAGASNTSIIATADFTNDSTININSDSLADSTFTRVGLITNNGTVNFGGTSTDAATERRLSADVINNGTLNVDQDAHLNRSGGVFTNNGMVSIDAGKTLDFELSEGTFNQDGGTLANNGTFDFSGDTLNFNGGNITGNAIDLTSNSTLNIGAGSTGSGTFNMTSTGSYSGDLAAAQTLNILAGATNTSITATADFTNDSTININSDSLADSTFTRVGLITNNGTVNFGGTSSDPATERRLSADVLNNGTVNVDQDAHLNRSGGVFTNNALVSIDAGKTLDFELAVGTFNQNAGTLANNGTFDFSGDTLNFNGGNITGNAIDLTSNSTLNIGAGSTGTGTFNMTSTGSYSGDLAAAQTLNILAGVSNTSITATSDFDNNGTININSDSAIDATFSRVGTITNNATINFGGTSIDPATDRRLSADVINNGTLNVDQDAHLNRSGGVFTNNALVSIDAGKTLDFELAVGTFNQNAGTLANNGTFDFSGDTLNFNGGNITGNAIDLTSNSTLNIGTGSTGTGTFNMTSTGSYSGDLAAAQTLNILAGVSNTSITATSDFDNNGTININSDSAIDATFSRVGTITNKATINFGGTAVSASTARRLLSEVVNLGTIDVIAEGPSTEIGRSGANHSNSGLLISREAGTTIEFLGSSFTNEFGGTLQGLGEMDFTQTGLTSNGTIAAGLSPGMLTLDGNVTLGSTSSLEFELGGLIQGTNYDFLNALDNLDLNGGLDVSLFGGFESSISALDTFTIISAGTLNGTFSGIADGDSFALSDGKGYLTLNYVGNDVVLGNFTAIPEPGSLALLGTGFLAFLLRRRRHTT